MTTTRKLEPTFPLEISSSFLDHLNWEEAWQNRIVCRGWRTYIENNLAPRIWLPDVELTFDPLTVRPSYEALPLLTFTFKCMADGGDAVFVDTAADSLVSEDFRETMIKYCRLISRPITTMSGFAHDITVPGLVVNWEAMELRLQWKDLFVQFLSTENKARQRYGENVKKQHDNAREMGARIDAGLLDEMEAFQQLLEIAGNAHDEAYRETRAARLGARDPVGDKNLKHIRHILSFRHVDFAGGKDESYEESEDERVNEGEDSTDVSGDELDENEASE